MYSKEELEKYIYDCVKMGESTSSVHATSSMRAAAVIHFGGWSKLLEHCGVKKVKKVRHYQKSKNKETKITDNGAIEIPAPEGDYVSSLCWDCFRPLSSKGHYCPWHDHFEMPKGAVFFYKDLAFGAGRKNIAIIVDCPLFIEETKELRKKKHEADIRQASYMRAQLMAAAYDK